MTNIILELFIFVHLTGITQQEQIKI